tara:strand:+ start:638 stop:1243 length:606 start_codon:yes stop_codon:yes gene_type:complete
MATVIYDFETSGLNPHKEDIIEIGAKCLDNDIVFQTLVKPLSNRGISSKITEITGITNELLRKEGRKPMDAFTSFFTTLKHFYDEYEGLTMIAHNGMQFDDIFLRRMHKYVQDSGNHEFVEMFQNIRFIDSLMVCRYIHPQRKYHNMKEMCMVYNVQNKEAHRAMGDVNALCEIWTYLMNHMKQNKLDVSGEGLQKTIYYY